MPQLRDHALFQKSVLWTYAGLDEFGSETVNSGVEIDTRWEKGRKKIIDNDGEMVAWDAVIQVDRDIAEGSVIRFGGLDSLPGDLTSMEDVYKVVGYKEVPDPKIEDTDRRIQVQRTTKMPAIVS